MKMNLDNSTNNIGNIGNHLCSIFQNRDQQFLTISPFFAEGLKNNKKCIYVTSDNSQEEILQELKKGGIDVDKNLKSGQLVILSDKDTYLKDSVFNPENIIAMVASEIDTASAEGYDGICGTGEMGWVIKSQSNLDGFIVYEAKLNALMEKNNGVLICQYDENKFSHEQLIKVIQTHNYLSIFGKIYENKDYFTDIDHSGKTVSLPEGSYQSIINTLTKD